MLSNEARTNAARTLRLSKQRLTASETLWHAGYSAEGLRLALDSLRIAQRAITETNHDAIALGFSERAQKSMDGADDKASKTEIPLLDAGILAEHRKLHRELVRAQREIHRHLRPIVASRWSRVGTRARRALSTLAVLLLIVAAAMWAVKPKRSMTAIASGHWDNQDHWHESHVVDGTETTEWAGPDGAASYIDITLAPARNLRAVEVLNGHNAPWNDRATHAFRIEAFSGNRRVQAATGDFRVFSLNPAWTRVNFAANNVTRLRFQVLSWHQRGAALAEIRLIER